ncbi:polysaccharide deacetylase family protein [Candidatus Uabimicrobium sp. HlEnr_7]|uniref:polysaccharide deacetylase family protein n=1 Tax=Candidatus Uabimicrobium helgolandensis TaxID=3095367 RepID=UPI003557EE85
MYRFFLLCLCTILPCTAQSLAESLGYKKNDRVVIINADDYGMCHAENLGTQRVLEYGIVSSATMMIPCSWVNESIEYILKNNLQNVGIHVALTSEWKNYRWRPVSGKKMTLVDKEGYMWRESIQVERSGSLKEIEEEVRAQLDYAISRGVNLSHFDSHMGSFYGTETNRVEFMALAMSLSYEYGLPFRVPYFDMTDAFRKKGFAILDYLERSFKAPKNLPERREYYLKLFANLPPGVTEVYIHPALATKELKEITHSYSMRQADVDIFTDPELKEVIMKNNIHVIDFVKLKEWQRKQTGWSKALKAGDVFPEYLKILEEKAQNSIQWKVLTRNQKAWRLK